MTITGRAEQVADYHPNRCRENQTANDQLTAVSRSVQRMYENLGEAHPLPSLAQSALLSPFHFHRVFRQRTASTPARFLAALRMAEAKRLLAETSINVTDICMHVGYSSLGTFTTQFTRLVGTSPRQFRRLIRPVADKPINTILATVRPVLAAPAVVQVTAAVTGGPTGATLALAGCFPSGIPQERPAACSIVSVPGIATFGNLTDGDYHVLAMSFNPSATVLDAVVGAEDPACCVGASPVPVRIHDGRSTSAAPVQVQLRPRRPIDPPLVLAFPLLLEAEARRESTS